MFYNNPSLKDSPCEFFELGPGKQAAIANRNAAVREVPIKRDGTSRDEYPFASTVEGGEGAWVGHVAVGEQSVQGGLLSQFFKNNGLNPGGKFRVVVE